MSILRRLPQISRIRVSQSDAWTETILLTLFVPLMGYLINNEDPFFLSYTFPWLLFASLLPAIRYGFGYGFASAILLVSFISLAWEFKFVTIEYFPSSFILGLLIFTMIIGEFTDMWLRKLGRQEVINKAQKKRLDEFTRNYQLLKVSHDRLENRLASSTHSLRESLISLKIKAKEIEGNTDVLQKISFDILSILSDFAYVQNANIFQVKSNALISAKPLATLGKSVLIDSFNPMVRKTLETDRLVSINHDIYELDDNPMNKSSLLATVPISDTEGHIYGIVAIQEIPFVAFHQENLQLIAVICGHIGDQISHTEHRYSIDGLQNTDFLHFIKRTIFDRKQFDIDTILLALVLPIDTELSSSIETMLLGQMRGLDRAWIHNSTESRKVVFLLMPLTSIVEYKVYKERMSQLFKEKLALTWDDLDIETNLREITGKENIDNMMRDLYETVRIAWKEI